MISLSELNYIHIRNSNSFEAEEGCNDDLAMCLVIYAWLVQSRLFQRTHRPRCKKKNI